MKPLSDYNIISDDWVVYNSKISELAYSLEYPQTSDLDKRIVELVDSYLNQWQFLITSYNKLYNLLKELNEKSDSSEMVVTQYDVHSILKESEFRDYSYLLIISLKTFLDLFACLIDIIVTQVIKPEDKVPSFSSLGKSKDFNNELIKTEFENYRNKNLYPWITELIDCRNKIMHRGYHLKPQFNFKKNNELQIIVFKGINTYSDTSTILIGKLFEGFMNDMPKIDENISQLLLSTIEKLENKIKLKVFYKFNGEVTQFYYSES